MMETGEKIFHNIIEMFEEHECGDWEEFKDFVRYATDDKADIGYIGGDPDCNSFVEEDLEEMNGIYFLTKDGVSDIMYFPITFDEFTEEIEKMQIFED